jgi:hypothetical protein
MKSVYESDQHHTVPVDRVAMRVLSEGEHFAPKYKMDHARMEVCPPLRITPEISPGGEFYDLIGSRNGKLTCIGIFRLPRGDKTLAKWVFRCDCGIYELRPLKSFRKTSPERMCDECNRMKSLRYLAVRPWCDINE